MWYVSCSSCSRITLISSVLPHVTGFKDFHRAPFLWMCSALKVSSTVVPRPWISKFPVVSPMLQNYSGLFFSPYNQNDVRFSLFLCTPPVPVILARLPHRAQTQLWVFPVRWDIIHPDEKSVSFSVGEPHCGCSQSLHFTICILLFPVWKWYMLKTKKKIRVSTSLFPVYITASGPQAASLILTFFFLLFSR